MSSSTTSFDSLFIPSGCLKEKTMVKYMEQRLSGAEREKVAGHLKECPFCKDALEGMSAMRNSARFSSHTRALNKRIAGRRGVVVKRRMGDRVLYYAVAATILLLAGIFILLYLETERNAPQISGLAVPETEAAKDAFDSKITKPHLPEEAMKELPEQATSGTQMAEKRAAKISPPEATGLVPDSPAEPVEPEHDVVIAVVEDEYVSDKPAGETDASESIAGTSFKARKEGENDITDSEHEALKAFAPTMGQVAQQADSKRNERAVAANAVLEQEDESDDVIFTIAEEMPEFPGGVEEMQHYLQNTIRYPDSAIVAGVEGTVYISFIVRKNGQISDAKVIRGIGYGCDEEALRAISAMPPWKPGKQRGKEVDVSYTLPVRFTLR